MNLLRIGGCVPVYLCVMDVDLASKDHATVVAAMVEAAAADTFFAGPSQCSEGVQLRPGSPWGHATLDA